MRVAVAHGPITNDDLLADWLVVAEGATLTVDASLAGALVWRLGGSAYRRWLLGELDARAVADGVYELGARSPLALDAAAELLPRRGGDALERAAFALLFAAGEPQEGLAAFLEKRRPRFR
jgi:enoyl-CoA hydratase/carnithine racemase